MHPDDGRPMDNFQRTIEAHGLDYNPDWVSAQLRGSAEGAGWVRVREIWSTPGLKPNGLFIADDMMARDVDMALRELRIRAPEDCKVVLATSCRLSQRLSIPVTRIENDPEGLADKMAELLFDLMAGRVLSNRAPIVGYKLAEKLELCEGMSA